jgi:hypothetical protein
LHSTGHGTFFGIQKSKILAALNTFIDALYEVALPYLSNPALFLQHCFHLYSKLIFNKRNAVNMMWGSLMVLCANFAVQLVSSQRAAYSGHKCTHGIKFQSVITPNGFLIACLFGPIPGLRHDSFMLAESELLQQLTENHAAQPTGCSNLQSVWQSCLSAVAVPCWRSS